MEQNKTNKLFSNDDGLENILRPKTIDYYIGQNDIKNNLKICINSAQQRKEALDHVLLYGQPGLGKTTLAHIIANELGSQIKITSGPSISKAGDLAAILTNLNDKDVLFIDEIHRLNHSIEEILYPAMEDYRLDFIIGKGPSAKNIQIPLPQFTLIGATTKIGMLSSPLRDRFGIICHLNNYLIDEVMQILSNNAKILKLNISDDAIRLIAERSRGIPRIANRILKRARDFAIYSEQEFIDEKCTEKILNILKINKQGLHLIDISILKALKEKFNGGPCGLETLAATISEDMHTIEEVYEPYLLQLGFIAKTSRGRILLKDGYKYLENINQEN